MRALARPMAAGLVICAGLLPFPPDALPLELVWTDKLVTKPEEPERYGWSPGDTSSPPRDRPEPAIDSLAFPAPVIEKEAPVAVSLAAATLPPSPAPVPEDPGTIPEPEELSVRLELAVVPPTLGQAEQSPTPAEEVAAAIAPERPPALVVAAVPAPPVLIAQAAPAPPVLIAQAAAAPLPLVTPPPAPTLDVALPVSVRRVDVAQIDESASGLHVPQLHETGLVPGGPTLAEKTAAMQVVPPPPARLSEQELALFQADTPAKLTVRLGSEAVGQVAFRMSETRSIDVQLSGLLDVLADRFAPEDFARLRSAAAADSYVPLDSLRAIGLSLRYDPVYDELRVSA